MYSKLPATTAMVALFAGTVPVIGQTTDESGTVSPTENVETGQAPAELEGAPVETEVAEEQAEQAEQAEPAEGILAEQSADEILTDEIIGADVRNPADESIGEITGLVLDGNMQVVGALVSVGGFLGIGDKVVGVGWADLSESEDSFIVQFSKEQLENAEPFMTLAQQQAEAEAEAAQQQMLQNQQQAVPVEPVTPEPAPAN